MKPSVKIWLFLSLLWGLKCLTQGAELYPAPDDEDYRRYCCYRVQGPIVVDGKLDEKAWRQAPWSYEFGDIRTGQAPRFNARAKLLWDDDFLYVGYDLDNPNVWGTAYPRDTWMFWNGISESIVKLYLDPDRDGRNFSEMHLNPANSFWDMFFFHAGNDHPWLPKAIDYTRKNGQFDQNANPYARLDWNCKGIKTAVYVNGTLNNSNDLDQGWSAELAIPWKSLTKLAGTGQPCPPHMGDAWAIHLARRYVSEKNVKARYMTWPKTNHGNCHEWTTWGRLIFLDHFGDPIPSALRRNGPRVLTGWGGGKAEAVVPKAAEIGFTELVVHHEDATNFTHFIELGKQHGIDIYAWLFLGDIPAWKKAYPDSKPPLQVMNAAEEEALKRIQADKTPGKSQYQSGGEPVNKTEVLTTPLLCFHDPRVLEAFKQQIDEMLSFPGMKGVAFDYIGYQNYRCCLCPVSQAQFAAYRKKHPELSRELAQKCFSLETLVDFNNKLADYVRMVCPDAKVITHVYPVHLPEPLYGNRLDLDVCAQTAAWYFEPFWSVDKIKAYSRVIAKEANQYYSRPRGAALIGVADGSPAKSRERLTAELQAILDGGCSRVHVCSLNAVLNNPETAEVFHSFFGGRNKQEKK